MPSPSPLFGASDDTLARAAVPAKLSRQAATTAPAPPLANPASFLPGKKAKSEFSEDRHRGPPLLSGIGWVWGWGESILHR
jgi:hypothetical protein